MMQRIIDATHKRKTVHHELTTACRYCSLLMRYLCVELFLGIFQVFGSHKQIKCTVTYIAKNLEISKVLEISEVLEISKVLKISKVLEIPNNNCYKMVADEKKCHHSILKHPRKQIIYLREAYIFHFIKSRTPT